MIKEFSAEVIRRINEDVEAKTHTLASGSCRSLEEYKDACGQIRGLLYAREHIEAALRNIEEDDSV